MKEKICLCGESYSKADWQKLPLVGHHHFKADESGPEENLEFRNCSCGSTLVVDLLEARRDS